MERALFGMRDDGAEGLCLPTQPRTYAVERPREEPTIEIGGGEEEEEEEEEDDREGKEHEE